VSMEDAHVVRLDSQTAYFGVFDGHGGSEVAKFAANNVLKVLLET
jgi:serine/threonine protein phosphatase PrpC